VVIGVFIRRRGQKLSLSMGGKQIIQKTRYEKTTEEPKKPKTWPEKKRGSRLLEHGLILRLILLKVRERKFFT